MEAGKKQVVDELLTVEVEVEVAVAERHVAERRRLKLHYATDSLGFEKVFLIVIKEGDPV